MGRKNRGSRDFAYALLGAMVTCIAFNAISIVGKVRQMEDTTTESAVLFEPTQEFSRAYAEMSSEFSQIGDVLEAGAYPTDPEHLQRVLITLGSLMKYQIAPLIHNISQGIPPQPEVLRAALDDERNKIRMNVAAMRHDAIFRAKPKEKTTPRDDKHWVEPLLTMSRYFYGAGSINDLEFSALTGENEHYKTLPWPGRRQIWLQNLRAMAYHILLLDAPSVAEEEHLPSKPEVCEKVKLPRFKLASMQDCTHPPADPSLPRNPLRMN